MSGSGRIGRAAWAGLLLALALGAGLRAAHLVEVFREPLLHGPILDSDFHDYWARGIVTGDWTPPRGMNDPHIDRHPYMKPPGYPWFLAVVYRLFGAHWQAAAVVQSLLGMLNIFLAWVLARRLADGVGAAFAALAMAGYWVLIYYETELLDPVLVVTLSLLLLIAAGRWVDRPRIGWAVAAGLVAGALALVRPNFLALALLLPVWMALAGRATPGRRRALAAGGIALLAAAIVIAPVTVRNARRGEFVPIAANDGINLLIGNNEMTDLETPIVPGLDELTHHVGWSHFDDHVIIRSLERREGRRLGATGASRIFRDRALEWIRQNPRQALWLTLRRAVLLLDRVEVSNNRVIPLEREASALLRRLPGNFSIVLAAGLLGLAIWLAGLRGRESGELPATQAGGRALAGLILLASAILYGSYLPFFAESRFRLPLVPPLILFGAIGVKRIADWCRGRRFGRAGAAVAIFALLALAHSHASIAKPPNRGYFHYLRSELYAEAGDGERRLVELRRAVELMPGNLLVAGKLGEALTERGDDDEAYAILIGVLQLKPDYYPANLYVGWIWLHRGDMEKARIMFSRALEYKRDSTEARTLLIQALRTQGKSNAEIAEYLLQFSQ